MPICRGGGGGVGGGVGVYGGGGVYAYMLVLVPIGGSDVKTRPNSLPVLILHSCHGVCVSVYVCVCVYL